jgi:hypothetical protein
VPPGRKRSGAAAGEPFWRRVIDRDTRLCHASAPDATRRPRPAAQIPLSRLESNARRGAGAVERGGLENRCGPYGPPRVRIPPPPLGRRGSRSQSQNGFRPVPEIPSRLRAGGTSGGTRAVAPWPWLTRADAGGRGDPAVFRFRSHRLWPDRTDASRTTTGRAAPSARTLALWQARRRLPEVGKGCRKSSAATAIAPCPTSRVTPSAPQQWRVPEGTRSRKP